MQVANYRTAIIKNLSEISLDQWENLRGAPFNHDNTPFLSYAYLNALEKSGCACPNTGWDTHYLTLWQNDQLCAALPLYLKSHSYGEYVFDWAWANAFEQHHVAYYPKLLSAIPFTPVSGARLLALDQLALNALIHALIDECKISGIASCHVLFAPERQAQQLNASGMLLRFGVQFHWENPGYANFTEFVSQLSAKKRKNILAERRKVREAGITFKHKIGQQISPSDWEFFMQCYQQTYSEHGGRGYLNLDFFLRLSAEMPQHLLMITAYRDQQPIAASLLFHTKEAVYGRYWGCIEYHSCLHFETAYYQPIEFCIAHKIARFEGGAQGEHKMARGFLPNTTYSAHFIHHPAFAEAIAQFLIREEVGIANYVNELQEHNPFAKK